MTHQGLQQYKHFFAGSGGGGGGKGKGGREAPDTVRSRADLTVLFGVCEGEVQGYEDKEDLEKHVYFNKTPIRNEDGTLNFENAEVAFVPGTQDQALPGYTDKIESDVSVNQTLRKDQGPSTRYISDPTAEMIRITLQFPGLVHQDGNNVEGSSVTINLTIVDSEGTILTKDPNGDPGPYQWTVSEKVTSQYEVDQIFVLNGKSRYKVTLERITDDSKDSKTRNDSVWARYTLISLTKLRHPNTVLLGVRVSSDDFSGIPEFGIRGKWLKCSLPHNYNPATRAYTGIFNGQFSNYGWTNNPAYILRQILSSTRYGVGDEIKEAVQNNFNLYEIGKTCDQMVDDGFGGQEPLFTINGLISEADDADKKIDQLLLMFRGLMFFAGGQLNFIQDVPRDFSRIYTEANVIEERDDTGRITKPCFTYEGTARKARHTACTVKFKNKDNYHQDDAEYVADEAAIARYSYNLLELDLPFVDSVAQAHREGLYKILTEKYERETINFSVGVEGLLVSPGEIFATADPYKQAGRYGGRIRAVSENLQAVTLDASVTLKPGRTYSLSCIQGERQHTCDLSAVTGSEHVVSGSGFDLSLIGAAVGNETVTQVINSHTLTLSGNPGLGTGSSVLVTFSLPNYQMTRVVTTASGTTDTLQLASALPTTPPINSTWVLSDNVQPLNQWRCLSVTPNGSNWDILGVAYSAQKFQDLETQPIVQKAKNQDIPVPPEVDKLKVVNEDGKLTIAWTVKRIERDGRMVRNPNVASFIVEYRRNDDSPIRVGNIKVPSLTVLNVPEGKYSARVGITDVFGYVRFSDYSSKFLGKNSHYNFYSGAKSLVEI